MLSAPLGAFAQGSAGAGEILIGQSGQLSGPLAPLTREIREGASWHIDQVNADGGVHGRRIRILAMDDAYEPQRAMDNVKQLIERDGAFALFNLSGTPTTLAVLPLLRQYGVPLLAPFTGSDALRQSLDRLVFNVRAGYADEIEKIVQHVNVLGLNRVAVAYLNNPFGRGGLDSARKSAARHGVTMLAEVPLDISGAGLQEAALQLARSSPPTVILATAGKITSDFIAAYQKVAGAAQFYALSVISSQQLIQALGDRSNGIAIAQVMPFPWGGATRLARELTALAGRAQAKEVTYNHMEGLVSAKVLVQGLRSMGPALTREGFIRALEGLRDFDLGGYAVRFSDRNHNGSTYVELTIVGSSKRVVR